MEGYVATVERFFLVLRRQGLMLSPQDIECIERWERDNIPVDVVCRGLLRGANDFRESQGSDARLPHQIDRFKDAVQSELANDSERGMLSSTAPQDSRTLPTTLVAEAFDPNPPSNDHIAAYQAAWRQLEQDPHGAKGNTLADADLAAVTTFVATLTEDEQSAIEEWVDERLAPERHMLGVHGLTVRREALLEDVVRERYGLALLKDA
jgi:hypothetical protein